MGQAHTKGPWKFSPWHIEEGEPAVRSPAGYIVCTTASNEDAEFITKACNAHDESVEVMEACKSFLCDLTDPDASASGASIIASFANAVSLRLRVVNALHSAKTGRTALSSARATGGTE